MNRRELIHGLFAAAAMSALPLAVIETLAPIAPTSTNMLMSEGIWAQEMMNIHKAPLVVFTKLLRRV